MANYTFTSLKAEYAQHWANMDINNNRVSVANSKADIIIKGRKVYESLQVKTGVPWYVIGLIHLRESDCDFNTHLHNGDPLSARTVHEPKSWPKTGKAPFTFEYSAVDALTMPGKELHKIKDWSIERIAYTFEQFNGFGYRARGVASPYLWASSNQYVSGKYIFDGPKGWRPGVVDKQLGAMVVLKCVLDKIATVEQPITEAPEITDDTPNTPTAEIPRPTNKEMRDTSRKWNLSTVLQWIFGGSTAGTATVKALDASNITATKSYIDAVKNFINAYGVELFVFGCLAAFVIVMVMRNLMKDDIQEGRATPSGEST